jgi:hypothetical protein
VVLVPAHDEELLIGRCVRSLKAQTYPGALVQIVVVADNCGDGTAAAARSEGAEVFARTEPTVRGKGHALRFAIDRLMRQAVFDAIVVVDADSVADPALLSNLVRRFDAGAGVVQGESLLLEDASSQSALRAAAYLLINKVRPAGRAVFGLPCGLAGNGMLFGRDLLADHPWDAFSSTEDAEYAIGLRRAGVRPVFAGGAIVRSPTAPNPRAAEEQLLRWEGGKLHLARTQLPGLVREAVREGRPSLLDVAFELAVPPLSVLVAYSGAGVVIGAVLVSTSVAALWALVPFLVAIVSIPLFVLVGFAVGGAPRTAYRSLLHAPQLVLAKTFRLPRLLTFRADSWVRTERQGDEQAESAQRLDGTRPV